MAPKRIREHDIMGLEDDVDLETKRRRTDSRLATPRALLAPLCEENLTWFFWDGGWKSQDKTWSASLSKAWMEGDATMNLEWGGRQATEHREARVIYHFDFEEMTQTRLERKQDDDGDPVADELTIVKTRQIMVAVIFAGDPDRRR